MKLNKSLLIIMGATVLAFGSLVPSLVNADDSSSSTKQGKTNITFTAPTTGQLTLDQVPSYNFGSNVLSNTVQYKANGDNPYTITNLTGDSKGYTVTANATSLKNGNFELPIKDLLVSSGSSNDGQLVGLQDVNIFGTAATVANGKENSNGTLSSGSTSAVMDLSTSNGIKSGSYTGTIDYTLSPNALPDK